MFRFLSVLTFYFVTDADINSRDHSGKKPRQVTREGLTIEAQGKHEPFKPLYQHTNSPH